MHAHSGKGEDVWLKENCMCTCDGRRFVGKVQFKLIPLPLQLKVATSPTVTFTDCGPWDMAGSCNFQLVI